MSCQHEHAPAHQQKTELQPKTRELDAGEKRARRKLRIALCCATTFMSVEIVGGILAGSLAILTDAAHLLSDVVGFAISLFAIYAMAWPTSARMSFGFKRAEVIGALLSILVIWILTAILVYEAINRFLAFLQPDAKHEVDGMIMFIIASVGLVMNIFLMFVLGETAGSEQNASVVPQAEPDPSRDEEKAQRQASVRHCVAIHVKAPSTTPTPHENTSKKQKPNKKQLENLNVQAAYIHALGDLVQSIGVCIAGGLVWYNPEWQIADPSRPFCLVFWCS